MKQLLIYSFIAIAFMACKNDTNKLVLTGNVIGMKEGNVYFIKAGNEDKIDSAKIENEHFTYETTLNEPTVYMINFGANEQPVFAILEAGKMSLDYQANSMNSFTIHGGKEQDIYNKFITTCKPIFASMDSLSQIAEAHQDDEEFMYAMQSQFTSYDSMLKSKQRSFISSNPKSYGAAFVAVNFVNSMEEKSISDIESIYKSLDAKVQQSFYGKQLNGLIETIKNTSVGAMAPEFTLPDAKQQPIKLSSFKGKITLIDFWASWCGPCRAENPNVVKAYSAFHSKGFEILGVSLDNQQPQWESAIAKDQLAWTQVSDLKGWNSPVAALYGIESIPSNLLLDKEGRIIAKNLRGEELSQKLEEIFKSQNQ